MRTTRCRFLGRARCRIGAACTGLLMLASCANPVPPTGGPADVTPPGIRNMEPADQSTLVAADVLIIEFDEYIDQASFLRALSITPGFAQPVDVSWRRRTATVRFPEPLRPNTTYVVQLDNNLRDAHGVALRQPIVMAFSTGPRINQGRISGQVVEPTRGGAVSGIDVYAYADVRPDTLTTLPTTPDYRTQTGADGRFSFRFLPEGVPFYVVAIADANRSRTPEPLEAVAAPPRPFILPDTSAAPPSGAPWITHLQDTIPPEPQRVIPVTSRRLMVRFSEPVRFSDWQRWDVRGDGLDAPTMGIPYQPDPLSRDVHVIMDSLAAGAYEMRVAGVADSSGNPMQERWLSLTVQPVADTLRTRFSGFWPTDSLAILLPGDWPEVVFHSGIPAERVHSLLTVVDTASSMLPYDLEARTGTRWAVRVPMLEQGRTVFVRIVDPLPSADTSYVRAFRRLPVEETGEMSGVVLPGSASNVVELSSAAYGRTWRVSTDDEGHFLVPLLPEGRYAVRAFADSDASSRWSGGKLTPYVPAEPLTWMADSVRVRARWETALEDTLYLPQIPENGP